MAERERPTQAAGSPEEQPVLLGQEVEEQLRFMRQESEERNGSPQDVVGMPEPPEEYDRDSTATHERAAATAAADSTSGGDAKLIGG